MEPLVAMQGKLVRGDSPIIGVASSYNFGGFPYSWADYSSNPAGDSPTVGESALSITLPGKRNWIWFSCFPITGFALPYDWSSYSPITGFMLPYRRGIYLPRNYQ